MSDNIKVNQEDLLNDLLAYKIHSEASIKVLMGMVSFLFDQINKDYAKEVRDKAKEYMFSMIDSESKKGMIEYLSKNEDFDKQIGDSLKDLLS